MVLLLPALALGRAATLAYLLTFLAGTVVAMGGYTACIGAGSGALAARSPRNLQRVSLVASLVALAFGVAFIAAGGFGVELPSLWGAH